jgi:branched-chain amino acid transport system substrate-binding protein
MVAPLTGAYEPIGTGNRDGAQLAVDQLNERGGMDGRQVELDVFDDKTDASQSVLGTQRFARDTNNVVLLGTGFGSGAIAALRPIESARIPTVSMSATEKQVQPIQKYVFLTAPLASVVGEAMLAYMQEEGVTDIALMPDSSGFAQEGVAALKQNAPEYNVEVTAEEGFDLNATDFGPQISRIERSEAQGLMVWTTPTPIAVTISRQFGQLGSDKQLFLTHGNATPQFLQAAGSAADGAIIPSSLAQVAEDLPEDNPSRQIALDFDRAYEEAYGKAADQFAYDGYTGVLMIAEAVEQEGATREGIQRALEGLEFVGPEGTYRYGPDDHAGLGSESVAVSEIRDGALSPITIGGETAGGQ